MSLRPVCKLYSSNRNCKFGKHCRFLHSTVISQRSSAETEDRNGEVVGNIDQFQSSNVPSFEISAKAINHEDSLTQTNPSNPPTIQSHSSSSDVNRVSVSFSPATVAVAALTTEDPPKICRYFKQHGRCAFGRNCRFLHDHASSTPTSTDKPREYQPQNGGKDIPPRFRRKEVVSSSKSGPENVKSTSDPDKSNLPPGRDELTVPSDNGTVEDPHRHGNSNISRRSRLCRYFKAGYCSRGKRCQFAHPPHPDRVDKDNEENLTDVPASVATRESSRFDSLSENRNPPSVTRSATQTRGFRPASIPPQVLRLSELQREGTEKYRQFDVNYLEKRFQGLRCNQDVEAVKYSSEVDDLTMEFMFTPSDPDWPFDIQTFALQVTFPKTYPEKIMTVKVPVGEQDIPETVRRYLEVSLNEWIDDRQDDLTKNGKAELMVRPFCKWLDRNCEELMTEGLKQLKRELTAKAAGLEFIPATQLRAKFLEVSQAVDDDDDDDSDDNDDDDLSDMEEDQESSDECLDSDDNSESAEDERKQSSVINLDTDRKGTEIELRHLQLKQNSSSLLFEKLRLIVQCMRCKHHSETTLTGGKVVALTCEKCSTEMFIQYRPTLVHPLSAVLGYLDLDGGQAFDLIFQDCTVVVGCLACSKITRIKGMVTGQLMDGWCQACNARFKFSSEAVKFYQLQPSTLDRDKKEQAEVSRPKTSRKPPKDPSIREGYPLPNFGACRHYKQSFRWLRFPCCGKAYPCDVCHDKKEDHEMVLANRMICGHCCKEQNYSGSRPCVSCSQHLTKVHSSHWEGGAGCRDKISMSRNDQQKYKNMNKTISKHKVKVTSGGGGNQKKSTKLRHA